MEGPHQTEEKDVDTTAPAESGEVISESQGVKETESRVQVVPEEGTSVDPDSDSDEAGNTALTSVIVNFLVLNKYEQLSKSISKSSLMCMC